MMIKTDETGVSSARPIALSIGRRILATALFLIMIMASLLVTSNAKAEGQQVQIGWIDQFGSGFPAWDYSFAVDAEDNVFVAGQVEGALPEQVDSGLTDAFVQKYDANGNLIWTRQFGSTADDYATGISTYSSYVYVTGTTKGVLPDQTGKGNEDVFVCKFDCDGNLIWTRQVGTSYYDVAKATCAGTSGIYVAGYREGPGWDDSLIMKFDAEGTLIWTKQLASSCLDMIYGICEFESAVYVTGWCNSPLPGQWSRGSFDAFVIKCDVNGNVDWTREFGTTNPDYGRAISADSSGVYVGGYSDYAGGFICKYDGYGNVVWTATASAYIHSIALADSGIFATGSTYNSAAFVAKCSFDGSVIWTKQLGASGGTYGHGISVGATGIYVTGETSILPGQVVGYTDAYVTKTDNNGNVIWTRRFGSVLPAVDYAYAVDSAGNAFVVGYVQGTIPGQTSLSLGLYDAFIRKYDPAGNVVWTKQFGGATDDYCLGVAVDASGVYAVGYTTQYWFYGYDAFVRKFDLNGNQLWMDVYSAQWTQTNDYARSVCVDSSGVYVTGYTYGAFPGHTNAGVYDMYLRKYDLNGNALWTRQFGGPGNDWGMSVSMDASGVYVAGYTEGTLSGQTSAGSNDAFIRKYDRNGNAIWTTQFGTSGHDYAYVSADASGVYVTGGTMGAFPGKMGLGDWDAYIRKYDSGGNEVWTRQFGTSSADGAYSISVAGATVYVAGYTNGVLPGQTSAGGSDGCAFKYDDGGNLIWTKQFGTSATDAARSISPDIYGVFVAGTTTGVFPGEQGSGGIDCFVIQLVENMPPSAVIDLVSTNFLTVALSGAASTDDSGISSYAWAFGDGESGSGAEVTHVYPADGTYTVTLTVTDDSGLTDTASIPVTVAHQPQPPSAVLGWTAVWDAASFDASLSSDPDGILTGWAWVFGDGATGEGETVTHTYSASGSYPVTLTVTDNEGLTDTVSEVVSIVFNDPPVAVFTDTEHYLQVSVDASSSTDDQGIISYAWTYGDGETGSGVTDSHTYPSSGTYTVALTVKDIGGKSTTATRSVTVLANAPPTILSFTASPEIIVEGGSTVLNVVAIDANSDSITYLFDFDGDGVFDVTGSSGTVSHTYPESGVFSVLVRASDGLLTSEAMTDVIVLNSAPVVTILDPAPGTVVAVGTTVSFAGEFSDCGIEDSHTALWILDSTSVAGTVVEVGGSGTVQDTFTFSTPGVYAIELVVCDDDGGEGTASMVGDLVAFIVVYDLSAGFVTGGGWINSPSGAYAADPTLSGRASFGFISKYQKGAKIPTGETEFQFRVANLNFHSAAYEWLVVSGARAQYKGTGTINGQGDYGFVLTVIDGALPGGGGMDRFRIKIWDRATDVIIYDNQMGNDDFADPTAVIGGGSIVIHKQ